MQFKFSALLTGVLLYATIASAGPADEFITVWQSDNPGESATDEIRFHGVGSGYTISWEEVGNELANNGTLTAGTIASGEHQLITFPTPGTYRVRVDPTVSGTFTQFRQGSDKQKLLEISQWGTTSWSGFYQAFRSCYNMDVTATDVPDLSLATTLSQMFSYCYNLTGNSSFNSWNTENITDMSGMFWNATSFNQPLDGWNTENVTNMFNMFEGATSFNENIGSWNTESVTNMSNMFYGATDFNQPINGWNTSSVTNMADMFRQATAFNQPINDWDVSSVTTMAGMFSSATNFNQPINGWTTSSVTNMADMFRQTTAFNQPINDWDVSSVIDMGGMFFRAMAFNEAISDWTTSSVTNMSIMFSESSSFNQPLDDWDVSSVTSMNGMFKGALAFNQPLSNWVTSSVANMTSLFESSVFNQDIGNWDVSSVTSMNGMFYEASAFNQDLSTWNLSSISSMSWMFDNCGVDCINYSLMLNGWAANSSTPDGIPFGAMGIVYDSTALAARTTLTTTKGWSITDDIYDEGCGVALPVTLHSFDAAYRAPFAALSWQSSTESGLDYYSVEKSADGVYFNSTTQVQARGSGSDYNMELAQPEDRAFYRLKMTDIDGKVDYSDVRMVSHNSVKTSQLSAFPNPVSEGKLLVKAARPGLVRILNCLGQQVLETSVNEGTQLIDVRSLPNGIYLINQGAETIRLIITQ